MSKTNKTYYGKEAKRIIKVGTNVGGFVAKIAAKNILGITQKDKNAEELTQLLGNLKGPIMKVAQILSTIPDAIPEEYAKKLSINQRMILIKRPAELRKKDGKQLNCIDKNIS